MAKITHIKINNSSTLYDLGGGGMVFDTTVTMGEICDFFPQGLVVVQDGTKAWIIRSAEEVAGSPDATYNVTAESVSSDGSTGKHTIEIKCTTGASGLATFADVTWASSSINVGNGALSAATGSTALQVSVPETPSANGYAASKKYVDDKIAALQSTLTSLQTTVNGKANQTDLTNLTNTVNNKADKSTVTSLQNTVNGHTTSINTLNSQNSKYSSMWQTIYNG